MSIINDEYHTIKNDAEEEILEYQYYHAGIKTGHAVRDFAFKSLPKLNLIPLPDHIGGSRKLDIFPYNFEYALIFVLIFHIYKVQQSYKKLTHLLFLLPFYNMVYIAVIIHRNPNTEKLEQHC